MEAVRIVVLDDSEITAEVARLQLESVGFDVRAAVNLLEFERVLDEFEPQIILTDVQMPDVPGDEVCRVLKRKMETESVPVFLFSSLPEPEPAARAERAGADGYIQKEAGSEALKERLLRLLDEMLF